MAERRKKETEVREPKELKSLHDPRLLQQVVTLTPSQKEKRQKEFEREKEGNQKEARELKEQFEVCFDPYLF